MSDIVEAMDIDGQLYVSGHNLPQFLERAMERGAEQERLRIMEIVQRRIDTHSHFVEYYMYQEVEPPKGVLGALVELRSLMREMDR